MTQAARRGWVLAAMSGALAMTFILAFTMPRRPAHRAPDGVRPG